MPEQRRIPYFRLDFADSLLPHKVWRRFDGAKGCKELDNPQAAILMERRPPYLPGEKALLAKQAAEKRKADAEEAKRRKAAQKIEVETARPPSCQKRKGGVKGRKRASQR